MNILSQMDSPGFRPSKLDQKLLAYLRENARQIPHMTISQLADNCGVGEATVTRFVKKMGYSSLQQFKVTLAAELTENSRNFIINRDISANESALVTGRKLLEANISTLEGTLNALPAGIMEKCAQKLLKAKRIRFIGLGNSGFTARDSAYKFYRIGLESVGIDNSHDMSIMAALAKPGDMIVALSQSGKSPELLRTLRLAHSQGSYCLLVTADSLAGQLACVDECIVYDAKESLLETGSITVKLAQFFIMDLLYTQVVKEMPGQALENKRRTAEAVRMLNEEE
ncbi:MAG: MurR/RpiR family transcriptional regulator [Selenomonas sp.]|uniref:MurR/RpiR family transcriptional regulator n=1 Tax=Selenomonas sp. TaxID=2053611 RepID=UPI0025EBF8E0|nr:MurR/RpiR family transcriptional regulator [Selenomonas sp.]MCR5757239.1 MurR/RpiR family transcriptional regulator [Selenomonas sp.]